MARLLAQSGSETAKAQAAALEEAQRIQADNKGHRMLQAMGWKEGQGLGAGGKGMAAPVTAAGSTKAPYEKGGLGAAVSSILIPCCWPTVSNISHRTLVRWCRGGYARRLSEMPVLTPVSSTLWCVRVFHGARIGCAGQD